MVDTVLGFTLLHTPRSGRSSFTFRGNTTTGTHEFRSFTKYTVSRLMGTHTKTQSDMVIPTSLVEPETGQSSVSDGGRTTLYET